MTDANLGKFIEWPVYEGKERDIVWRYPHEDINWGSILLVHEYEDAVFFRDGKAYGILKAGRHVLNTDSISFLSKIFAVVYGQNPFRSTIFFISTKEFSGMFGTRSQTKELFPLIANGQYWYKIADPLLFVNEVVGGNSKFTTEEVNEFLRAFFNQNIMREITGYDLASTFTSNLDTLSGRMKLALEERMARFGIDLFDLKLNQLDTTPEYRNLAVLVKQGVPPTEVLRNWTVRAASKELGKSQGAGIGAGLVLPQMMSQPAAQPNPDSDPLTTLKMRYVKGEITKEQYEEMRKSIDT